MTTEQFIIENSLNNELWKPIKNFEDLYMISSYGRILSCNKVINNRFKNINKDAHLLKWNTTDNTPCVILSDNGKSYKKHIAKLVAEHFLNKPNPEQVVLDYKDGNKMNCSVSNLYWRIQKYNQRKVYEPIINLENEEWRSVPIEKWKESYQISNYGRVKSLSRNIPRGNHSFHIQEHIITPRSGASGYMYVSLGKSEKYIVHRLVALAFIPNPDNLPQVDHINTIRSDNRIENLRWVTAEGNMNNTITKEKISIKTKEYFERTKDRSSIACYSKDQLIKEYDSIDAAISEGFTRRGLLDCLKGIYKTHKGFTWKYI